MLKEMRGAYGRQPFRRDPLNQAIGDLIQSYTSVTVEEAIQSRTGIVIDKKYEAAQKAWPVSRKWAQEFYHLRNEYAHGGTVTWRTWGWYPLEHLVMAAFVFPLLVKVRLTLEGHYVLTEDDEGKLRAIDKLLTVRDWGQRVGSHSNATAWQETLRKSKSDLALTRVIKQAVEDLKRQRIFPPDDEIDTSATDDADAETDIRAIGWSVARGSTFGGQRQ